MPIHTPKYLGSVESLPIPFDLPGGQTGEAVAVHRSPTQEERPEYDIVHLVVFIPQASVHRQVQNLSLVIADQSNRIIEN